MFFYQIPAPNEALVISGAKQKSGGQFEIVTGHGRFVAPWSKARYLSLDLYQAQLQEPCVTQQGIKLTVEAVAAFKVGDDTESISNAARRFLDQQKSMVGMVQQLLAGHLRSIVGGMTVEDIIRDRNRLAQEVKDSSSDEMTKLGLTMDSFQIREITDPSNYITSLSAPHVAEVQKQARIAQAQADQSATQSEQLATGQISQYQRDSQVQQAQAKADVDAATAKAAQAGPLSQAQAAQEVTEAQTVLANKQAEKRAAELVAEVQKPADAQAYQVVKMAEAERDAAKARAEALEGQNLNALVTQRLADQMPELMKAVAGGLQGANVTIINGAEGYEELLTGLTSTGMGIFNALKQGILSNPGAVSNK